MGLKDFNTFNEGEDWSARQASDDMDADSKFKEYMHSNWGDAYHTPEFIKDQLSKNEIIMAEQLKRVVDDSKKSNPHHLRKWVGQYIVDKNGEYTKLGFGKYPTADKDTSYVLTHEVGGFAWTIHSNYKIKVGYRNSINAEGFYDDIIKLSPNTFKE